MISRFISSRTFSTAVKEQGKKWAGCKAMDYLIQSQPTIIGLGSGSTIVYAIEHLAKSPFSKHVICIPTSFQTRQLILSHKLKLGSLEEYSSIDMTIDGADEVDSNLNAIKGGGGCLFQEKLVAQASSRFILVADMSKKSSQLGTQWRRGVPVEVIPLAITTVEKQLRRMFPSAQIQLRMATPTDKAGPVVTDNGNLLLDCDFGPFEGDPYSLYKEIKCISGVLEVGLFCNMAEAAYFGSLESNTGEILTRKQ